ncbi:hypothetical protein [Dictyobacter kobayashii]|uniref:Uncharacterized protein n=1 Tax=Dictyobacter kobayashii TaxID=2014872 RepID=A0A402AGZ2_9CHLR|nr:hypothetical protein [Dictyobacter kobayashii]GCE18323.1 hypothetical protein KDK_21230 [Dictyobacter kobayashii]
MDSMPLVPHNDPETEEETHNPVPPRSLADIMSWGEQLLPIAYATLEACWIAAVLIGLARLHFFALTQPFAPLWAPFLLMIVSAWCALILPDQVLRNNDERTARTHSGNLAFLFQGISVLCVVWGTIYAGGAALWNPAWLMSLLSDFLLFNQTAFAVVGLILLSYAICYRGIKIARYTLEPSETMRGIILGSVIFLGVCLLPNTSSPYEQIYLLLLILIFFSFALLTRALSHAIFVRQEHLTGLQGSKFTQDRLILYAVGMVCLFMAIIGLILGITINPTLLAAVQQFLSPAGKVYDGAVYIIAWIMAFLVSWIPLDPHMKLTMPTIHRIPPSKPQAKKRPPNFLRLYNQ